MMRWLFDIAYGELAPMEVEVLGGRVAKLGEAIQSKDLGDAMTTYAYVELSDRRMIRKLTAIAGLNGELREAFQGKGEVELHVATYPGEPNATLLALRAADGRLFATQIPPMPLVFRVAPVTLFVAGFALLPLFGLGLHAWLLGAKAWRGKRRWRMTVDYIAGLGSPTLI